MGDADGKASLDATAVARCLAGDESAYVELLERYEHVVFNFVIRFMRHRSDAEDVTQEVFINAFNHLAEFRPEYRFSTWLFKIARNQALYRLRGQKTQPRVVEDFEAAAGSGDGTRRSTQDPLDEAARNEFKDTVLAILAQMPEKYRLPLVLRHIGDASYQEISEILDMNIGTVKTNIHLGRKVLRQKLEALHFVEAGTGRPAGRGG